MRLNVLNAGQNFELTSQRRKRKDAPRFRAGWSVLGFGRLTWSMPEVGLQKCPKEQGVTPNERQSSSVKRGGK